MSGNFENLNKQIASFIIMSAALSTPVVASSYDVQNNLIADGSIIVNPMPINHEVISMYAAPEIPIFNPNPIVVNPPVLKYAAPEIPTNIINPQPPVAPIVKYAAPQMPNVNSEINSDLNSSSSKLNSDITNQAVKLGDNLNKSSVNSASHGFVITDYGNVRVIEPYSHIIFK